MDNFHRPLSRKSDRTLGKSAESDNVCGVALSDLEYSALAVCRGCGGRFVATGAQVYCSHECYSATLRKPLVPRFWAKVNKTSGCWLWTAATIRGYGQIAINRRPNYAHRVSWELAYGAIPVGAEVLHTCDVPLCVRPDHLFLGSQQDNLADARAKGRLDESRPRTRTLTYEDRLAIFNTPRYRGVGLDLARKYGVSKACISVIRKGRFARRPMDVVFQRVPSVRVPIRGILHLPETRNPRNSVVIPFVEAS